MSFGARLIPLLPFPDPSLLSSAYVAAPSSSMQANVVIFVRLFIRVPLTLFSCSGASNEQVARL